MDWHFLAKMLTLLNIIANPIIAVVAIIALRQLSIAKSDIRIRSKREAVYLATQQAEKFTKNVIPLVNKYVEIVERRKIPPYNGPFDFGKKQKPQYPAGWYAVNRSLPMDEVEVILGIMNHLNDIAAVFVHKLADESVGFSLLGESICKRTEEMYLYMMGMRSAEPIEDESLIQLYGYGKVGCREHKSDLM